ncbi:MAG TPA: hypothetical protein VIM06_06655, partial [Rhodanobacter sp.]
MGIVLTAMCASAQAPQTGTVPQTDAGPQGTGNQGTGSAPLTPGQQQQVTAGTSTEQNKPIQVKKTAMAPEEKTPAPDNGGLTYLPELKPTDGVVNLAAQPSGDTQIAGEAGAMHEKP